MSPDLALENGGEPVRLALVGCGAIGLRAHLPAIAGLPRATLVLTVDEDPERAREAATGHDARPATDYREVPGAADAAIVAVPNHLHAPVAEHLLRRGVHVLVEKPMAPTPAECRRMNRAAAETGAVLAVGLVRRFYRSSRFVRDLVAASALGKLRRFTVQEGTEYRWPVATAFPFRREEAGGGVLADIGVHVLDLLSWWLGDCAWLEYRDDARGGVEAECRLALRFANGVAGTVLLSRLRDLPGLCRLEFENGTVELDPGASVAPAVRVGVPEAEAWLEGRLHDGSNADDTVARVYEHQLEDFLSAITERRPPLVPGTEGLRSVALIERCYAHRMSLVHPWEEAEELRPAIRA